jgi:hypothetical protein
MYNLALIIFVVSEKKAFDTNFTFLFWHEIQNGGYGRT